MQFVLSRLGAEVLVVESGTQAMQKRSEFDPTVIISDIGLPDMDGYSLIRNIRELERQEGRLPITSIAVSAFAQEEDRHRALAAGFTTYFSKPIDLEKLIQDLSEVARGL
jgi:CheY-like chemotaxis protein